MKNQTIRVNFIIQRGKANKEGKCPILAQITVNREMKYLGTKQYILPERWEYGKTIGLSRDDKHINQVLDEIKHNILPSIYKIYSSFSFLINLPTNLPPPTNFPNFQAEKSQGGVYLVTLNHIRRVLGGGFPRAEGDKSDSYCEDYSKCYHIYPPRRSDAVGELLQPA